MKRKQRFFDDWLKQEFRDPKFRQGFEEEDLKLRVGLRIFELRKMKKLSQANLAKMLHTTQQVISDIETFKHPNLTLVTLQKIAQALDRRLIVDLR